jgi:hypothetical protein
MNDTEYRKLPFLSYSSIKDFDESRNKFYRRHILKEPFEEKRSYSLIFGDLVDCLLFTPEDFDRKFAMLAVGNTPTGQMKSFVDNLWELTKQAMSEDGQISRSMSSLMEEAFNLTCHDKNGERVMFKGKKMEYVVEEFPKVEGYYKTLRENYGKTVIDSRTYESGEKTVTELMVNPVTKPILTIKDGKDFNVYRQLPIIFEYEGHSLKLCAI